MAEQPMIAALALGAIVFAVYVIAQIVDARNTRRYNKTRR